MATSHELDVARKWRGNIQKLLLTENICCVCLTADEKLQSWDVVYSFRNDNIEHSLKSIIKFTFGDITNLLPTSNFCENCISTILKCYKFLKEIKHNYGILQQYFTTISDKVNYRTENDKNLKLDVKIGNIYGINIQNSFSISKEYISDSDIAFKAEPDISEPKYECPYCGTKSNKLHFFEKHFYRHSQETAYQCSKCSKTFHILDELIKHRKKCHLEDLTHCNTCNIILHQIEIVEHETKDHEIFICDICEQKYETKFVLERHITEKHSKHEYKCVRCLQCYHNESKLNHHRCPYKCFECKHVCIHEKYLSSYRDQHMSNKKIFQCTDCEFTYMARNQLIYHVNEEHLHHFPYFCDICGDNFPSRPLLTKHTFKKHADVSHLFKVKEVKSEGAIISSVLNERPYECELCGYFFNSEDSYTSHREKHLSEQCKCSYCSKIFFNIGRLNMHVKNRHPDKNLELETVVYQCTMCTLDFSCRTDHHKHMRTHPEGSKHICRECNEEFQSKTNYFSHVRKHQIIYDRECLICYKKYTKHTIARHMKSHAKDGDATELNKMILQALMCDVCGVSLPNEKALIKHSKTHNEERQCMHCNKYVNSVLYSKHVKSHMAENKLKSCVYCNYTTRYSVCLEGHVNRHHLKVRPYQCEICSKTFFSEYTLKGHKLTHVDQRPECYCEVCGKRFISKKALMLHTRIHTGEQPYPCDLCDLKFLSASRRKQHRVRKHFEPSVECEVCKKKLYTQSDLRRHMGDCHNGQTRRKKKKKSGAIIVTVPEDVR